MAITLDLNEMQLLEQLVADRIRELEKARDQAWESGDLGSAEAFAQSAATYQRLYDKF